LFTYTWTVAGAHILHMFILLLLIADKCFWPTTN